MIRVVCCRCRNELFEPGGVFTTPPQDGDDEIAPVVRKLHVCAACTVLLLGWLSVGAAT